eukprot:120862_1
MSRFFRTTKPFIRNIGTISTPLCVTFGIASTVPTNKDAPDYVQDAFTQFNTTYALKTEPQPLIEEHSHKTNTIHPLSSLQPQSISTESKTQSTTTDAIESTMTFENTPIETPINENQYLSRFIDHTVLKPKSTKQDIIKMCQEAIQFDFYSVCCNPCWVSLCKQLLKDTNVKICCVVGFPLGSNTTQMKLLEAQNAVKDGANEIDMVMNIGNAKSGNWEFVYNDIAMVVQSVPQNVLVKVILETCLLNNEEIIEACGCAVHAGAKFVKTSTGFGGGGATLEHVELMRKCVDEEAVYLGMESRSVLVKASGGIRDSQTAKEMIKAGADRIGASSGVKIIGGGINNTGSQMKEQY